MSDKEVPKADTNDQSEEQEEEETPVTMLDVLQDEESLEADAAAVLGNADDKNCTYNFGGYMKRQALYSCLECTKDDSGGAGICLACSYHCHEGHELVELYTKRNFRCDCGNDKMKNGCKLVTKKDKFNEKNTYNQNFKGDYCTCHRPYPDPEDSTPDQMIQCILCEDWYHGRHLIQEGQSLPKDENYAEMICKDCFGIFSEILGPYLVLSVDSIEPETTEVDVEGIEKAAPEKCTRIPVPKDKETKAKTLFLPTNWRKKLCQCDECLKLYKDQAVAFLVDPEDTVHHYESQAKNETSSQYEKGMEALSAMDRVKQVEAIQGYNSMKANLMEYLKKFAENGKVVKQEDIQEFFQKMAANKRQRVEIPKFCK